MKIRSFVIAYALVLAILLFAARRPKPSTSDRYSHVVDLTSGGSAIARSASSGNPVAPESATGNGGSLKTRIVAPDALIPGTWTAGQIPAERLVAPLVVMDAPRAQSGSASQISLDDIADWEAQHGVMPQGAVVAIRRSAADRSTFDRSLSNLPPSDFSASKLSTPNQGADTDLIPITTEAARFLMDARYTTGFAIETAADLRLDRTLARQIALHGNYVVEDAAHLDALPATGSLIIVAPQKSNGRGEGRLRVLAMVR